MLKPRSAAVILSVASAASIPAIFASLRVSADMAVTSLDFNPYW
jgi:hypothetical protein